MGYDIDDILEEARRLKAEREKGKGTPAQTAPRPEPAASAPQTAERLPGEEKRPPAQEERPSAPEEPPAAPEDVRVDRRGRIAAFFTRRREQEDETEEAWEALAPPSTEKTTPAIRTEKAVPLQPAAEQIPLPPAKKPETAAPEESLPAEPQGHTRVIELPREKEEEPSAPAEQEEEEQLTLDGYMTEEEEPGPDGEDLETRLQRVRQQKVEEFQKKRETQATAFKLSGDEEEDNDPAEEPEVYEEEELEDYGSYEETAAVHNELRYRRRTGWIGVFLTLALEAVLVWMGLVVHFYGAPPMDPYLHIGVNGVLLLVMLLINHQMVGRGLASLVRLKADSDSAPAVAGLLALAHTLLQFVAPAAVANGSTQLITPVAGLCLLLGALGRQARIARICTNFRFVSYPGEKYAAHRIADRQTAEEVGRAAVAIGEPQVAYFKGTPFLTRFLENSYAEDGGDRTMKLFVPGLLAASAVLAVLFGLVSPQHWWGALTVFCSAVCLSTPAVITAMNFPLFRAARRTTGRGGMVSGWGAVKEFGHLHALVVDAADLFPSESVLLHGIKTFSGARIDEAILDAAAVSIAAGGPLAAVFRRIIEDKVDILPAVDSLVYEQSMGLTGWVAGRRVLVGNRRLLENHGVDVPSRDYELRYTQNGRQLVYLSTAGELSAMFVLSYVADEGIAEALHSLEKAGITVLVRTCDPNVTEELICSTLDIDSYYVELLGNVAGRSFSRVLEQPCGETPAVLASNGRIEGMAAAVAACRRLRVGAWLGLAAQLVAAGAAFALSVVLAFHSGMALPPVYAMLYMLAATVLSWILPSIKRI